MWEYSLNAAFSWLKDRVRYLELQTRTEKEKLNCFTWKVVFMLPTGGISEEHSLNIYKAKPFLKILFKH